MRMTYLSVSSPSWAVTRFLREKVISARRGVLAPFVAKHHQHRRSVLGVHLDGSLFPSRPRFKAVAAAVRTWRRWWAPEGAVHRGVLSAGNGLEELHRGVADAAAMTSCPIVAATSLNPTTSQSRSRCSASVRVAEPSCEAARNPVTPSW